MLAGYAQNPIKGGEYFSQARILTELKYNAFYLSGKLLPNCSKLFLWQYEYKNFDLYVWIRETVSDVCWHTNKS